MLYPGAVAVASGMKYVCAYVGFGLPTASASFQPALPPAMPAEYDGVALVAEADDIIDDPAVVEEPELTDAVGVDDDGAEGAAEA